MAITVYTKPACVQCNATYRALDKAGIEYDVIDITDNAQARDYVMSLGYQRRSSFGRRHPLRPIAQSGC
nr:glutaredoxin domain-containing protein [Rhodococcus qingshengii]